MIEVGFTGRDGQFHELTESSKKIARKVIEESARYARNQIETDLKHKQQDEKIELISALVSDNEARLNKKDVVDNEQTKRIESLSSENKRQNKKITQLHESLSEKEKIDNEQTYRLEELTSLLDNKGLIDQKQEEAISKNAEAIKLLFEYTKQKDALDKKQSADIERIKMISQRKLCIAAIIISSVALVCSIINFIL